MNIKKLLLLIFTVNMIMSCSEWLDVAPDDQVNEKTLFKTGEGYRNALNGVYRDMADFSMYGRELSWGMLDVLSQMYNSSNISSHHVYGQVLNYQYEASNFDNLVTEIWGSAYNAIANCNNLISRIRLENDDKFAEGEIEKKLILGEALGLRAYIHFDMLRLFGPSPREVDEKTYIPYFETYGSTFEPRLSFNEIISRVERDLKEARILVGACDTLAKNHHWFRTMYRMLGGEGKQDSQLPDELFFAYRGYRMNYYAVTATLARVYSWMGKHEEAFECANEVIYAHNMVSGSKELCFYFTDTELFDQNRKTYDEIIFCLSNQKLIERYEDFTTKATSNDTRLTFRLSSLFSGDQDDDRRKDLFTKIDYNDMSTKYMKQAANTYGEDMIPMIRVSEMYYIISEYYYNMNYPDDGIYYLDYVRTARGCAAGKLNNTITNLNELEAAIVQDAKRDFIGEGQTFYHYKKFNIKPSSNAKFVLPLPEREIIN